MNIYLLEPDMMTSSVCVSMTIKIILRNEGQCALGELKM